MHFDTARLEAGLGHVRESPSDEGTLGLIVVRPAEGERQVLDEAYVDTGAGVHGDTWLDRRPNVAKQVTVMNIRAVALIGGARERWPLAGDQLYVDFDLSGANLPPGTQFEVGSAVLEVSVPPHRGCKKFLARFGDDALSFVNSEEGCALNLRGINTRVVRSGLVRTGDTIRKLVCPAVAAQGRGPSDLADAAPPGL
ncbi:MAG TPA: hypothetical protein VGS19_04300 [Streptosporangiaceae bacterium]|nr:hypothetical protein [Streptosporangiaceae bacterium]